MIYNETTITNLSEWLRTGNATAYNYLIKNNKEELIKTIESILMSDKGLYWLVKNKFYMLSAFVKAVEGETKSINFLLKNNGAVWAATAGIINDDQQAEAWLKKNGMLHYVVLGNLIRKKLAENKDGDFAVLYRGPF